MKPTLQFTFDDLAALHRFLTKIIPVVDDGTLTETTMQTLKDGAEKYKPEPAPEPEQSPLQEALQQAEPVPAAPVAGTATAVPVPQPEPVQAVVPTTEPTYSLDELARAASTLADSGDFTTIKGVLAQFGVSSLPELQPEQYGAFATAIRALGAQI